LKQILPIRNNVLIKPAVPDEMSSGGIIVPDSFKGDSNKGIVMAVGNGTKKTPMRLKTGMTVFRVKDWGTPVEKNGEKFYLMDQEAVIAKL